MTTIQKRTERVLHLASLISNECEMAVAIDLVETFLAAIVVSSTLDEDPNIIKIATHVVRARAGITHPTTVIRKLVEGYTAKPLPLDHDSSVCDCPACSTGREYRAWRDRLRGEKRAIDDLVRKRGL